MSPHRHIKELGGSDKLSRKVLELLRNREKIQQMKIDSKKRNGTNYS